MIDRFLKVADEYEAKAAGIRRRVSSASAQSQHIMNAEAAAYERVCRALRAQVAAANSAADEIDMIPYA
jgi:hypothetical protein